MIPIQKIKDRLSLEDIGEILESLGCEQIVIRGNTMTSTKGNGSDNPSGIVIWDNDNFFNAEMYTTPEFDSYGVKDIFAVIQQVADCNFNEARRIVEKYVDVGRIETDDDDECDVLGWLDKIEHKMGRPKKKESLVYDMDFLDQFPQFLSPHWKKEGITEETAKKFDIRYDDSTECIIIPIYDEHGELVGAKNRETKPSKFKYGYLLRSRKSLVLYGLYQNIEAIRRKGEVIVFEAEKSVLKADSLGIDNTVAIGGKIIGTEQARTLNQLGVDIVLALDEDVSEKDIEKNIEKIAFPFPMGRIFVLQDECLLPKESPADNRDVMLDYKNHLKQVV